MHKMHFYLMVLQIIYLVHAEMSYVLLMMGLLFLVHVLWACFNKEIIPFVLVCCFGYSSSVCASRFATLIKGCSWMEMHDGIWSAVIIQFHYALATHS
jgi:hypothetical protein